MGLEKVALTSAQKSASAVGPVAQNATGTLLDTSGYPIVVDNPVPIARRLSVVGFGNSHMAANPGFFGHLLGRSSWLFRKNAGIGGNTSAMLLARVATDVPNDTDFCIWIEGTNSAQAIVNGTLTYAQEVANLDAILSSFRNRGIRSALVLQPPGGASNSFAYMYNQVRMLHLVWAESRKVPVYDPYRVLIDPATGYYTAGSSTDGTHAVDAAAKSVATQLWTDITTGRLADFVPLSNEDRGIHQKNSLLLTDTDSNGVPNNWTAGSSGTYSLSSASADGIGGNWFNINASGITASAYGRIDCTLPRTGNDTDEYHLQIAINFLPTTNCSGTLGIEWRSADGLTLYRSDSIIGAATTSISPVRIQRRFLAPAGAGIARIICSVQAITGGTAYTGSMKVGEFRMICLPQTLGVF